MSASSQWPFEVQVNVIFRDLDAMGHVNNAVYFTYMETARTTFFTDRLQLDVPMQLPVIVAEATCTYLAPLMMGETVWIGMCVSRIGRRSFDLAYLMKSGSDRPVARAKTVMVTYDYERREAIPIPAALEGVLRSSFCPEDGT